MSIANQERLLTVVLRPVISEKATMVADKPEAAISPLLSTIESIPILYKLRICNC